MRCGNNLKSSDFRPFRKCRRMQNRFTHTNYAVAFISETFSQLWVINKITSYSHKKTINGRWKHLHTAIHKHYNTIPKNDACKRIIKLLKKRK